MSSPPPQEFGQQEEEKKRPQEEKEEPGDDPSPEGDPTIGKPPKRNKRRLDVEKVDQSKVVDIKSLRANPLQEVLFLKQPALLVKAFAGNNVYVANTGDKDVTISVGTFLRTVWLWQGEVLCQTIKTRDDFVFTSEFTTVKEVVVHHHSLHDQIVLVTGRIICSWTIRSLNICQITECVQ